MRIPGKVDEAGMVVVSRIAEVREVVARARAVGRRIGVVPTMGALHEGHLSLIQECRRRSEFVAVTIFVNPTQFAPHEDLAKYPRPLEADLAKCRVEGVDLVFTPEAGALYPDGFETYVSVERMSKTLEGAHRPTHFRGVTTVVTKLFNIVQPDIACFGQKDYQQQAIIRRMVRDLDMPIEIIVCPTVREPDGLAMSSRNVYLSDDDRQKALSLYQSLKLADERIRGGESALKEISEDMLALMRSHSGVEPDYAVITDADTLEELNEPRPNMVALVAARVGATRLIDNLLIEGIN